MGMAKETKFMSIVLILIGLALVALGIYVRNAEISADDFHKPLAFEQSNDGLNSAGRVLGTSNDRQFEQLITMIAASPRTVHLAGNIDDKHISFVTRSLVVGFPDIVTVSFADGVLRILSRSYFGRYDLGVNAKRVDAWLASL